MTTGNSGVDGIIDRHEESRNALKILGCHQTIHLNFADTRAHLQLNDMISATENIIKNQIPSDVEIIRVYTMHDADRHQDHLAVYQASMVACRAIPQILGYETPSTAFIYASGFESVKEEYFSLKLTALKNIKVRASEIICARSVCVQLLNFAGNRSIAIWVKVLLFIK